MTRQWKEELKKQLLKKHGKKNGQALFDQFADIFPVSYRSEHNAVDAQHDIIYIEKLSDKHPLDVNFYILEDQSGCPIHLRVYQWKKPEPLSQTLPLLENLGLSAYSEHPYKLSLPNGTNVWISDFAVTYTHGEIELENVKEKFEEAFVRASKGDIENDGYNKLILSAGLTWREIIIIRSISKYLKQVEFRFSRPYIEKALVNNKQITRNLIDLFHHRHDPSLQKKKSRAKTLKKEILQELESVSSLDEDRIIRRLIDVIKAIVRTNYYQKDANGEYKYYTSYKIESARIPELPLPLPMYEIFVYSPRFEGIHLRTSKVARGGLRWSDRPEDFRTEVLGLMKAQKVKNAVIVPSGAKGGFVVKTDPKPTREEQQQEVIACYQAFISSLLDITDNIINDKFVPPKDVVCHDEYDAYLVVAADKGTATFSDIANKISSEYGFWLGDAFASGGSAGYDHKKMGITARGAWESVKRHFRELNIDISKTDFTVAGVGDMSGDVFGNGMLYTNHIKLIAAFDHRHIFIDPNPDAARSYKERERLFKLPSSSWESYNAKLISKGGGVFSRNLKSIPITPQMKKSLGITANSLAPAELIQAILKAPVDLLFNGGIGTYVKASTESNADVGDRANDYTRVNASELRCKVVGEGGNLGLTELARVEYALNGGLINTDFIDNSAGVDCSDHEVNLKILLGKELQEGRLTLKKRDPLLASLTDNVAQIVLRHNFEQALLMSFSAFHAEKNIGLHEIYIKELENQGIIDRQVDRLPDDKTLSERKAANKGLTRPEIAVLVAYTKIHLKNEILNSDLTDAPYLREILSAAFPEAIAKKYKKEISDHRLNREIIATQLSNKIVNQMGVTYVYRIQMETGATAAEIIRAYTISSHIFNVLELNKSIESLDFKIDTNLQYSMLYNVRQLVNLSTRWFLQSNRMGSSLKDIIDHYTPQIKKLEKTIAELMGGKTRDYMEKLISDFQESGLTRDLASRVATARAMYTTLNIIEVSTKYKFDLIKTAKVYLAAGECTHLLWFRDQIAQDSRGGHWNVLARLTLRDELDVAQRALTISIIKFNKNEEDIDKLIQDWMADNARALDRWNRLLTMLHDSTSIEYTMFFIALRELLGLIATTETAENK